MAPFQPVNMPFLESAQYAYAELAHSSVTMLALHLITYSIWEELMILHITISYYCESTLCEGAGIAACSCS